MICSRCGSELGAAFPRALPDPSDLRGRLGWRNSDRARKSFICHRRSQSAESDNPLIHAVRSLHSQGGAQMRRDATVMACLVVFAAGAGCAGSQTATGASEADIKAVKDLEAAWVRYYAKEAPEKLSTYFADDG